MLEKMLRFGIIGCGGIANWHAAAIRAVPAAKLTAVCDHLLERSEAFAKENSVVPFSDVKNMLESGLVDAVCICTPSGFHAEQIIQALRADIHVIAEKPITITPETLEEVLRVERVGKARLTVISQLRFMPEVCRARQIVHSGALGKITMADLSMKYFRQPSYYADKPWRGSLAMDGGGALMNQGIHGVDLMRFLCGEVEQVAAFSGTLMHNIEAEDTLSASLAFRSGALGVITATTSVYPGHPRRLEICGTKGTLVLSEGRIESLETAHGESINNNAVTDDCGASSPLEIPMEPHRRQIADFVDSVLIGREPALRSSDAAGTLRLIFALYESARVGASVKVIH